MVLLDLVIIIQKLLGSHLELDINVIKLKINFQLVTGHVKIYGLGQVVLKNLHQEIEKVNMVMEEQLL